MSDVLFKEIRNKVVSTTGSKVTDKDISLIIYLYEESKAVEANNFNNT